MEYQIRLAQESDLENYINFSQKAFTDSYVNPALKLTPDLFSQDVFRTEHTVTYLKSNLEISSTHKAWLAFDGDTLIGSVTIVDKGKECEMKGFYVERLYQGKGIGRALFQKALGFAGKKDVILDTYTHNKKGISVYLHFGFTIDEKKGRFARHWPEWPEEIQAECLYLRYHPK